MTSDPRAVPGARRQLEKEWRQLRGQLPELARFGFRLTPRLAAYSLACAAGFTLGSRLRKHLRRRQERYLAGGS